MTLRTLLSALALLALCALPAQAEIRWNDPGTGARILPPDTQWVTPDGQGGQQGRGEHDTAPARTRVLGEHILLQHGQLEGTIPVPVATSINPLLLAHDLPTIQNWVASGREITNILRLATLGQMCALTRPTPAHFADAVTEEERQYRTREGVVNAEACELVDYTSRQLTAGTVLGRQVVEAVPLPTGANRDYIRGRIITEWENIKYTLSVMLQRERGVYRN